METFVLPVFCEFLECCVHSILYYRNIYPKELFERRSKYGITVWYCRHPEVQSYIVEVLENAKTVMETGRFEKLLVTEHLSNGKLTNFFEVQFWLKIEPGLGKLQNAVSSSSSSSSSFTTFPGSHRRLTEATLTPPQLVAIEESFQQVLLRLSLIQANDRFSELPDDGTWNIVCVVNPVSPNLTNPMKQDIDEGVSLRELLLGGKWTIENESFAALQQTSETTRRLPTSSDHGVIVFPIRSVCNETIQLTANIYSLT